MTDRIIGPDISFYQDDNATPLGVDFEKMRAGGAGFVIIRAGQNNWVDSDFKTNWANAKAAGLPRGCYWFYDSREDPKKQAELWVATLGGDLGELPLWCDFEDTYGGAFGGWRNWYNFIVRLQELLPNKEIGVYTGYYYWKEYTLGKAISIQSLNWFKQFPLWIANYKTNSPLVPLPWSEWTLWQYTDKGDGKSFGVESLNIDMNYFNGDGDAFRARFGLGEDDGSHGAVNRFVVRVKVV